MAPQYTARIASLAAGIFCSIGTACAPVLPPVGRPGPSLAPDRTAVIAAAGQARVAARHLRAELRLVSFGPAGRLRGRAEVWVSRPDKLRYTLFGPHGGPLVVLTCDGTTLAGMDVAGNRYVTGAATAESFDAWLGTLRLHLDAEQWVQLLLGEITVPQDAVLAAATNPGTHALSWDTSAGLHVWAAFAAADGRLQALRLSRSGKILSEVTLVARDPAGVPKRLQMQLPDADGQGVTQVEVTLQDVELNPLLPPQAFVLAPAPGMVHADP
jgi:hypothetical protein